MHPKRKYRHRQLRTATNTTFEEFDGDIERVPAGAFCDFPIRVEQYGSVESWTWENKKGEVVHQVFNPNLKLKFRANGKSFWTIDEGWDYVWPNKDSTPGVLTSRRASVNAPLGLFAATAEWSPE